MLVRKAVGASYWAMLCVVLALLLLLLLLRCVSTSSSHRVLGMRAPCEHGCAVAGPCGRYHLHRVFIRRATAHVLGKGVGRWTIHRAVGDCAEDMAPLAGDGWGPTRKGPARAGGATRRMLLMSEESRALGFVPSCTRQAMKRPCWLACVHRTRGAQGRCSDST